MAAPPLSCFRRSSCLLFWLEVGWDVCVFLFHVVFPVLDVILFVISCVIHNGPGPTRTARCIWIHIEDSSPRQDGGSGSICRLSQLFAKPHNTLEIRINLVMLPTRLPIPPRDTTTSECKENATTRLPEAPHRISKPGSQRRCRCLPLLFFSHPSQRLL